MSFRNTFNSLKQKWDEVNREYNILPGQGNQQPQQQYYQQQYPAQQSWQPYQQPQYYGAAPAPPPHPPGHPQWQSHADSNPYPHQGGGDQHPINPGIYWQPRFDPSAPISQEWDPKVGNNNGWGNAELEYYTANPENAFYTRDNKLIVRAIANDASPDPAFKYTSARLVSRHTLSRARGVLTAILTLPCAAGIWPAFWLLPHEPFTWPHDGEVDIAETWNGDKQNHSCLHWGFFSPEDGWKHRVRGTDIGDMDSGRPIKFDFAWDQNEATGEGRMLWYIDGRPVMKATIPQGTRKMKDFQILLNVAMGGNVCAGKVPMNGAYDMIVHALFMASELEGGNGWQRFDQDFARCPEGDTM